MLALRRFLQVFTGFFLFYWAFPSIEAFAQQGTFISTGSMNIGRYGHTPTLLNNGKVLVAGGADSLTTLASAELYNPATGAFTLTGSMATARVNYSATLLNDSKVLIAGGMASGGVVASAELFDPATGTFSSTGSMTTARANHSATLLNNGKVLVAGGVDSSLTTLASAELYDPTTGTFAPTSDMATAREDHTATLLNDGKVLVAGGTTQSGCSDIASAESYDPAAGTFSSTGSMATARSVHTATLLNNGKVLVAGGRTCQTSTGDYSLASSELYDPAAGTFSSTGNMIANRDTHTATLLNNGKVLVAAGLFVPGATALASAELYDPSTGGFTATASMTTARWYIHFAPLLNNGAVFIAGGSDTDSINTAELYELVVVSPTSLSFSDQVVGTTSAAQTVTLTNNQSTTLNITSIAFGGTSASDFAETDNCAGAAGVAAGASCTVNVAFTPTAPGTRAASLIIAMVNSGSPLPVPLTGTGVTATRIANLSASSLTFPNIVLGATSAAQSVTLSNTGNTVLAITALTITGTNASDFAETDTCGGSVAAGGICTINMTFAASATGIRTGILNIADDATSPPSPQTVTLSGTGISVYVSVTPSSVTFPSQYVGTSGLPQSVMVTNNGSAALSITSVTANPGDFGTLSACGSSLAAGVSCSIGVFFDPTTSGARAGTLTINDNWPRWSPNRRTQRNGARLLYGVPLPTLVPEIVRQSRPCASRKGNPGMLLDC